MFDREPVQCCQKRANVLILPGSSKNSSCCILVETAMKVEFVVPPSRLLIIGTGVVGGFILLIIILLLLLKCGFFKRNRPEEFVQEDEFVNVVEDSPLMNVNSKENGVSENNSTEKENGVKETSPSPDPPNTDE